MPKSSQPKPRSLSHGRPPILSTSHPTTTNRTPSSRLTRRTICTHHQLQKALSRATISGDISLAASLTAQLNSLGGLQAYQAASLTGQSRIRGGDTSKILLKWLNEEPAWRDWREAFSGMGGVEQGQGRSRKLRMLDVGALSADTAASRSGAFEIERIDLHSQGKEIKEQDFMERPLPGESGGGGESMNKGDEERFDIVCLSLVVNYVPDANERGEMLKRVREFLVPPHEQSSIGNDGHPGAVPYADSPFPSLFLVLPAPCILNSRYLTQSHLTAIMSSLGFHLLKTRISAKLAYYLWKWNGNGEEKKNEHALQAETVVRKKFPKREIVKGKERNNFAIVI